MKKAPHKDGAGSEYINALNKPYSTPSRTKHHRLPICRGCGAPFRPARHWHTLCHTCFQWDKALTGVMITREAFREMSR